MPALFQTRVCPKCGTEVRSSPNGIVECPFCHETIRPLEANHIASEADSPTQSVTSGSPPPPAHPLPSETFLLAPLGQAFHPRFCAQCGTPIPETLTHGNAVICPSCRWAYPTPTLAPAPQTELRKGPSRSMVISGLVGIVLLTVIVLAPYFPLTRMVRAAVSRGRPPAQYVDEAVRTYYQEYFLSGNAIELTSYRITHVSREHLVNRNVVLYELRVTGTYKEDHTDFGDNIFSLMNGRGKRYRKDESRMANGRLAFWREGSRWYCCNPDTYPFGDSIYWTQL